MQQRQRLSTSRHERRTAEPAEDGGEGAERGVDRYGTRAVGSVVGPASYGVTGRVTPIG